MAAARPKPWRPLLSLLVIVIGLGVWALWPGPPTFRGWGSTCKRWHPGHPGPQSGRGSSDITDEQLQQTVEIIRQRVNGFSVAEADVAIQGSGNDAAIVVSVPGVNQRDRRATGVRPPCSTSARCRPSSTRRSSIPLRPSSRTPRTTRTTRRKEEQQRRQRRRAVSPKPPPVLPLSSQSPDTARLRTQRRTRTRCYRRSRGQRERPGP